MTKPRIFIGSSSESLSIATACNVCLDHSAEVSVWPHIFELGNSTLESLAHKANNVDFALFVFAPNDLTIMRDKQKPTVRDNVLFELGLFIGSLGKERCFILRPRGVELYMPTDLLGVNTVDFEPNRQDADDFSAVNAACARVVSQMEKLGSVVPFSETSVTTNMSHIPIVKESEYNISDFQLIILANLLETSTESVTGTPVWNIKNASGNVPDFKVNIAITKLVRIGFLDKEIDSDMNGNEWYTYKITNSGVEYILENEELLDSLVTPSKPVNTYNEPPIDFDDSVPF